MPSPTAKIQSQRKMSEKRKNKKRNNLSETVFNNDKDWINFNHFYGKNFVDVSNILTYCTLIDDA